MKSSYAKATKDKGRLIVFEGADGSGKTTHAKLLFAYFQKKKIPSAYISFPRYKDSVWGAMVRRYLDGDFGRLDPYLASMLYAGDRFSAAEQIRKWMDEGKIVVSDRYIASNIGHQAGKFEKIAERRKFIKWLETLEYGENKIPREDVVIFLDLPLEFSLKLMKGRVLDIHEADKNHQKNAIGVYKSFAKSRRNWRIVEIVEKNELLSIGDVHEKVLGVLRREKII